MPRPERNPPPPPSRTRILLFRTIVIASFVLLAGASLFRNPARSLAQWNLAWAEHYDDARQVEHEMQSVAAARSWDPNSEDVLKYQLKMYSDAGEPELAVDTLNAALEATPDSDVPRLIDLLWKRSDYLQQLRRHEEAIADIEKGVELVGKHPQVLNGRAYFLARAAADGYPVSAKDLGAALEDMRQIVDASTRYRAYTPYAQLQAWEREVNYLDTLAYLQLQAGDAEEGLRNLNRALELCETLRMIWRGHADKLELASLEGTGERIDTTYAVVLHHRGEALKALGNEVGYYRDTERAKQGEHGYSRLHGRW